MLKPKLLGYLVVRWKRMIQAPLDMIKPREVTVERNHTNASAQDWIPMEIFGKEQIICSFKHLNL